MATSAVVTSEQPLQGWKAIAVYLRRGVRTVQRWERCAELPVHRIAHNPRAAIFAYPSEIDAWLRSRPLRGYDR